MIKVTKEMTFDAAHRLYKHEGNCGYVHGHTYKLQVTVGQAAAGMDGMVIDFSILKDVMSRVVDTFDHTLILSHDDPLAALVEEHRALRDACIVHVMSATPTAENMATEIALELMIQLGVQMKLGLKLFSVKLWETPTSFAERCYE